MWQLFRQLVNMLGYLERGIHPITQNVDPRRAQPGWEPIVHRYIKPDNVLIHRDPITERLRMKLADFGNAISLSMSANPVQSAMHGDLTWAPPETPTYGPFTDIFMVGSVIQSCCRLDGPTAMHGPEVQSGRECRGVRPMHSAHLDRVVRSALHSNWQLRPSTSALAVELQTAHED